jgi:hypothetical protein
MFSSCMRRVLTDVTRCAGRGSRARTKHVRMRQRRDTPSLASSRISSISIELYEESVVLAPVCLSTCMREREGHLDRYDIPNDLSAEPLSHPINIIIIISPRPALYPLPRVVLDEFLKGPQFFIQAAVVLTPYVGLSRDGLRHLVGIRERWEISRNQAVFYGSGGRGVHRNWLEGP